MSVALRKYLFGTALLTVLTVGIGTWIFHMVRPALLLADYIWMPLYFYVIGGLLMAGVVRNCGEGKQQAKKLLQAYLLARIIKLFVSVVVVVAFCLAVHTEAAVVVAAFVINYLLYLVYDSWFFSHVGKSRKMENV